MSTKKDVQEAHDYLLFLGQLTVRYAEIDRMTIYPSGKFENDVEHSFHLAISAVELAANYHPELDVGLVSQFSIVHDLPEVYAGDTPSFIMSEETELKKKRLEQDAIDKLLTELPPHTAQLLERYEAQVEPEARFVRLIDKLLPAVIHAVGADHNREEFIKRYNLTSKEALTKARKDYENRLKTMFPEFKFALLLQTIVAQTSHDRLFSEDDDIFWDSLRP